jgi:hypothetical protein
MHTQTTGQRHSVIGCDPASVDKNPPKVSRRRQLSKSLCRHLRRLTLADSLAHVHLGHFYGVQLLPGLHISAFTRSVFWYFY